MPLSGTMRPTRKVRIMHHDTGREAAGSSFVRLAPGIQYVAADASGTVRELVGGWADVAGRGRMEQGTTMLYSMTKTFTAAAVDIR